MSKIFPNSADLLPALAAHREQGRRIVFANGCFDVLHVGHLRYLQAAAGLAEILLVAVNSDQSVSRLKGSRRPVNPLSDRMELLSGLRCVSYVTAFEEDTPLRLIERVIPDLLVKGADWDLDKIVGKDVVESHGGSVQTIPLVPGRSTTATIAKILNF